MKKIVVLLAMLFGMSMGVYADDMSTQAAPASAPSDAAKGSTGKATDMNGDSMDNMNGKKMDQPATKSDDSDTSNDPDPEKDQSSKNES